jgi:hypothetical protein
MSAVAPCGLARVQSADFLPDVPNVNVPKSLGVVMPRQILEDWSAIGFDPWSAGKQLRTTSLVSDLSALERKTVPDEVEKVSAARVMGESVGAYTARRAWRPCRPRVPSVCPVPSTGEFLGPALCRRLFVLT